MSQNKTVVPGIGDVDPSGDSRKNNVGNDFYSRGTSRMGNGSPQGTFVPGMHVAAGAPKTIRSENPQSRKSGDPVIGFLYSISRQGVGEYWPVHVGRNRIGRDADNDVILAEYTVSGFHATLSVRKMNSNGKVIALIRDEGSKTGLRVNGEELGYEGHECFNGDIITVGCNYTLLLILVNAEEAGLSIAEHFEDALEEEEEMPIPVPPMNQGRPTFNPYDHNNRSTMAMDGSVGEEPGGTKFM
ncbi:FHA domain-containing protein [Parabacteroides sp.]|uniref:FHA domain-containing protein n=1 Tax=Parabacteroides sp. TaxID=1869337 RepID=UPI00257E55F3|nr:FHA domain-containing protein [Parabacteroides sp.]